MALIKEYIIEQINDASLCEVIGKLFNDSSYKIRGSTAEGKSPWNNERTASFKVNDTRRVWKDFSSGNSGKTAIQFAQKLFGLDFRQAVEKCAQALNITIEYEEETLQEKQKREEKNSLQKVSQQACSFYQKTFQNLNHNHWAKKYMREDRGFSDEILERFEIGYASANHSLYAQFKEQASIESLKELGILKVNASLLPYEFFLDRILFPIHNKFSQCVGLAGRISPEKNTKAPKYINSPQSVLYQKDKLLYGYFLAEKQICETEEVYLVEGYTDVMRMHQIGLINTVATCGTSLSSYQISVLKKYAKKVILFRDADTAGEKAARRDMELLLKAGLSVEMVVCNTAKDDPDTIGRKHTNPVQYINSCRRDALTHFLQMEHKPFWEQAKIDAEKQALQYEELHGKKPKYKKIKLLPDAYCAFNKIVIDYLQYIEDPIKKSAYKKLFVEQFDIKEKDIDNLLNIQKKTQTQERKKQYSPVEDYIIPESVTTPFEEIFEDIKNFGIFQSNNQIWAIRGDSAPYYFESISNFSIEIIQHMDGEYPSKLISIRNIYNRSAIFETESHTINTLQGFINVVTNRGNFVFRGKVTDHKTLTESLFSKMGEGSKIEELGWQEYGFWVWNNGVVVPEKGLLPISKDGIFVHENVSYYIPSANEHYQKVAHMFSAQKKFKSIEVSITLTQYLFYIKQVHRQHAITGILFAFASLFQDFVYEKINSFPILFLYGKGSSGKDSLSSALQSFTGKPQTPLNLENKSSTRKGRIREFAQFKNAICNLAEYKKGDAEVDAVLKSLWDRIGYKRGTIASRVANEEVPITSSAVITSNEFPGDEPLLTRLILEEMNTNEFSQDATEKYDELKQYINQGISALLNPVLNQRKYIEKHFEKYRNEMIRTFKQMEVFQKTHERILTNLSVLGAFFLMFEGLGIQFPFTKHEMISHFIVITENLKSKISSNSLSVKFWNCVLSLLNLETQEKIVIDKDFRVDGDIIYFNFTNVFSRIQRLWYTQYKENAPSKTDMINRLKEDKSFVEDKKSVRINKTLNSSTSAFYFRISDLVIHNEIKMAVEAQQHMFFPPVVQTPQNEETPF